MATETLLLLFGPMLLLILASLINYCLHHAKTPAKNQDAPSKNQKKSTSQKPRLSKNSKKPNGRK